MAMSAPENAPRPGLPALKFGIIIPVGPSANDVERAGDVLASVLAYEPETPLVLFIDDGGKDRRLDEKFRATATCRLVNIFNTRNGHGIGETSGLSARIAARDRVAARECGLRVRDEARHGCAHHRALRGENPAHARRPP
jgi:hypothetical protein